MSLFQTLAFVSLSGVRGEEKKGNRMCCFHDVLEIESLTGGKSCEWGN